MVIGYTASGEDVDVNVCKTKHLTNTRSSGSDVGERAAGAIANLVRMSDDPRVENVDWVVIDDGAGTYIAQESV